MPAPDGQPCAASAREPRLRSPNPRASAPPCVLRLVSVLAVRRRTHQGRSRCSFFIPIPQTAASTATVPSGGNPRRARARDRHLGQLEHGPGATAAALPERSLWQVGDGAPVRLVSTPLGSFGSLEPDRPSPTARGSDWMLLRGFVWTRGWVRLDSPRGPQLRGWSVLAGFVCSVRFAWILPRGFTRCMEPLVWLGSFDRLRRLDFRAAGFIRILALSGSFAPLGSFGRHRPLGSFAPVDSVAPVG
jgi:hypothetical protein